MTDFLLDLLSVSLGGGLVILPLLLLARVGRLRHGAKWRCFLWLALCLRMAVPGPILPVDADILPAPVQLEVPAVLTGELPMPSAQTETPTGAVVPVDPDLTPPAPKRESLSVPELLFILWLTGALGFLLWNLLRHGRFLRYLHSRSRESEDSDLMGRFHALGERLKISRLPELRVCRGLPSPMLAGLFRPVLLLPEETMKNEILDYALLHELTHYRGRHIWLKALTLWVCALHWFNPLVWLMVRGVERDTELACDEGVLTHLPQEEHAAYGRAILAVAAREKGELYER